MYFEHLLHRRKLKKKNLKKGGGGGSGHESQKIKKNQITIHGK